MRYLSEFRSIRRTEMTNISRGLLSKVLIALTAIAVAWTVPTASAGVQASVQSRQNVGGSIEPGTTIYVRTTDEIDANTETGRVFSGVVDRDVVNGNGRVVIPHGSDVELVVRTVSENELALDLDSVVINGARYGIEAQQQVVQAERKEGIGANKRTGKYVGGGAVIGAVIGAIAGGGKGAAIGAGAGAAAGAGAQVLTRGQEVHVPAESLLTFRLSEPLQAGTADTGYTSGGVHYHAVTDQNPYQSGLEKPGATNVNGTIYIGPDKKVSWTGPENAAVYVQVDNAAQKLLASGPSGTVSAPWIMQGHIYTFILKDANGAELARNQLDFRGNR
jgi:hypothetical protein